LTISQKFDTIKIPIRKEEGTMKEIKIMLSNVENIRNFVNEVILVSYDVDLMQGRYTIDAKSIMGIFSLNLRSPITLIAHTDDADEFFARIDKFVVK
jgi:phosphotransferase system HPr-like phosphotransfer protein